MSATGPAIKATLGLDTAPLKRDLAKAQQDVGGFGKSLGFLKAAVGAIAIRELIQGVRGLSEWAKELNPELKKTTEELAAMQQAASGLSDDQLRRLAETGDAWDRLTARVKGYGAALVIAANEARKAADTDDIAQGGTGGFFGKFRDSFNANKPDGARAAADAQARLAAQEEKKVLEMREKIADIDSEIEKAKEAAMLKRADIGKKIEVTERKIREAQAAQVGEADELKAAKARQREEVEKLVLEEQKLERLQARAKDILAGPDARRENKRQARREERALARAGREQALEDRGGMAQADFDRAQRLKRPKIEVGEMQGPQMPKDMGATEATMKAALDKLSQIAANLGVRI